MTPKECSLFQSCDAPICPLDERACFSTWFPTEAICSKPHRPEKWIATQKKIAKKSKATARGYFTLAMLQVVTTVGCRIEGVDPDTNDAEGDELAWIERKRKTMRREKTPEELAELRERGKKLAERQSALKMSRSPAANDSEAK